MGICSAGGRIGGALSPLIFGLDEKIPIFSNLFFGLCAIIAGFTSSMLPETMGKPMCQTTHDIEELFEKDKEQIHLLENNFESET